MQKQKLIFAVLSVLVGVFIFTSSLVASSQKQDNADSDRVSRKQLYFGKKILPDHIFYPALMVVDKSLLFITSGESEVFLRIRLAQDRMISANSLLDKNEEGLAFSTLTKSQKYLLLASQEFLVLESHSKEVGIALLTALEENTQHMKIIQKRFKNVDTSTINDLVAESETLISIVKNKIQQ